MSYPDCVLCSQPVVCGQHDGAGRPAHYSCLGICQSCFGRPASTRGGICGHCGKYPVMQGGLCGACLGRELGP